MCFEDPDVIDEVFWNETDALAMIVDTLHQFIHGARHGRAR
ncbi:hypothetical protein [Streptomyces sp. NPDC046870]